MTTLAVSNFDQVRYPIINNRHTLNEAAESYKDSALRHLHESTVFSRINYYKNHVEPYFGNSDVTEITTLEIENWINNIAKSGYLTRYKQYHRDYSVDTLNRLISVIYSILDQAKTLGWIANNPAIGIKRYKDMSIPDPNHPKFRFYTYKQFSDYIKHAKNPKYKLIFEILFFMGLRSGELRALAWEDIDLSKKLITIRKTMNVDKTFDGKEKATLCKTKRSNRILSIPDIIHKELIDYYKEQSVKEGFKGTWYTFGDTISLHPKYLYRNNVYISRRAKMERINIHGFRHSCVSYLKSKGVPAIEIAAYIGDREDVVNKIYSHVDSRYIYKISDLINKEYKYS